ncbi:murein biosynthesis integral membrane protein MurJ [Streptomyces sp. NPDC001118]
MAPPAPSPGSTATASPVPSPVPSSGPASPPAPGASPHPSSGGFLARATLVTAVLSVAGALLGLGRDQALARLFGAGVATDAFLVAWTVPEMAATLLIEDGMAFLLVPAFSGALARRAGGRGSPDPVRALVAASLPRLSLAFAAVAAVLVAGAPLLVGVLAPGLPHPALAIACTRLTATCVLTFGLAGYCSSALRAHRSYLAPATIYVAYNTTIIATMFALGAHWGVRSAALGVALGGCLMGAVQAPSLWRRIAKCPDQPAAAFRRDGEQSLTPAPALVLAVLLFALCRQSQVLIERHFASLLPAGAISHLNYAQKIGQLPMSVALMLCVVTFPVLARAMADGDTVRARDRIERDLVMVTGIVLLGAAVISVCAPQIVQVLFQRGAFTAQDTAATATVLRVYTLGLLGHTLVGALVRSYFSAGRTTWYPTGVMAVGMVATAVISACTVGTWGASGIAAANSVGITVTALLLLRGLGGRSVAVRIRRVGAELAMTVDAALGAAGTGYLCTLPFASPLAGLAAGCLGVSAVYLPLVWLLDVAGARSLTPAALRTLRTLRRFPTRRKSRGR